MATTNPAPSLLSRLSPLPREPRSPPSESTATARSPANRNGGVAIARAAVRTVADEAAGQAFLGTSSSPSHAYSPSKSQNPRSYNSPRRADFGRRKGDDGSHLSSLPDDVFKKGQPIPPSRSTNSSRWAASPPSASSLNRSHPVKRGFSPMLSPTTQTGSSPPTLSSASPSTSPALQQIETMLSQLRTSPSSSKHSVSSPTSSRANFPASVSPSTSTFSSTRSPGRVDAFPSDSSPTLTPFKPTPGLPGSAQSATVAQKEVSALCQPTTGKLLALGGKSRWARDSDEDPDPVDVPIRRRTPEDSGKAEVGEDLTRVAESDERDRAAKCEEAIHPEENLVQNSEAEGPNRSFAPLLNSQTPAYDSPSVAGFHHDWADDDDDDGELPDLDDWGVSTEPVDSQPERFEPPPLSPTMSSTSSASARSKRQSLRDPFTPAAPPTAPYRQPIRPTPARSLQNRPPKPVATRLFETARAAAAQPPLAKQLPPHQKQRISEPVPSTCAQTPEAVDRNWRAKGTGPSPALFSKLSGMGTVGGSTKSSENGASRRSRRGRSRTSSAAAPPASDTGHERANKVHTGQSKEEAWTKVGGAGTHSSRWA